MMKQYLQLEIEATEAQQEILISQLADDAEGFEQKENKLIACLQANVDQTELQQKLKEYKFTIETIDEKNWNQEWEQNFQPVIIGRFCSIRADFHPANSSTAHDIIITPKMSFGTGHHATTHLMVLEMSKLDFNNKKVFDFGTGTGVLSILSEKLGAEKVVAIDVDEWSITNALENFERNYCSRISVELSTTIPQEKFDIVLANINRNVILEYLTQLEEVINPGGKMLLSGLLESDFETINEACTTHNLQHLYTVERNNWISVLYVKQR